MNLNILLLVTMIGMNANAQTLKPYKDQLFSNEKRTVVEARDKGAFKKYSWNEKEAVNGRDEVPGVKAKAERLDLDVLKEQRVLQIPYQGGVIDTYEVGQPKDAKFAVIFVHGGGGTKEIGANDVSFGGNFNRIKNLATRNEGVYYSPSVNFNEAGHRNMMELIKHIKKNSPNAKIVLGCGSAGAITCWEMMNHRETVDRLSGLVFLGGAATHPNYETSEGYKAKIPIIISHGDKDPAVPWTLLEGQFESIRKNNPNYPVRFELYQNGKHGTPLRMLDWKESLEWIFKKAPEPPAQPVSSPASAPASVGTP